MVPVRYVTVPQLREHIKAGAVSAWDLYGGGDVSANFTCEHVFPVSHLAGDREAAKDAHNIHAANALSNLHRSNYRFADAVHTGHRVCAGSVGADEHFGHTYNHKLWMHNYKDPENKMFSPVRSSRGIIARAVAYMAEVYSLDASRVLDCDLLVKWNAQFPPTRREISRNEEVARLQGNLNPFVVEPGLLARA